ncbi:aspartic proteinase CDR1-like [Pistacia vera]|uniref:aspartic proteinase CDR1-like n=1 Tax=Pistacia vera TaxID=55513 RepID=UPI001262C89D|nr:aspartic proteinase CDR1-like [Pistacia vera]
MEGIQYFLRTATVFLSLVTFCKLSYAASKSSGFTIRLIPSDSLESPLYEGNLTQHERIERNVNITRANAKRTKSYSSRNGSFDDDKHFATLARQRYRYVAQLMIGNPIQTQYLVVDTASSVIWTQCDPCIDCFPQIFPIYNPEASSSYYRVSCDHPRCFHEDENSDFRCINDECVYSITYGSGDFRSGPTEGFFSSEALHLLNSQTGQTEEFRLLFGCSNNNIHFEFEDEPGNIVSGIMGLDLNPNSLNNQLSDYIYDIFSYCIVPYHQDYPFDVHPLLLRFGEDVYLPSGRIPATNYYTLEGSDYYYVELEDISVGVRRLHIPPDTFNAASNSDFFFDTGAPFSILTTRAENGLNIFELVVERFAQHYNNHGLMRLPASRHRSEFEYCYRSQRNFRDFPSMTFHFRGADYIVDGRFMKIQYQGFFCVALIDHPSNSILGAYQMQNMRIIHNGMINAIQFFPEDCADDHI